MILEKIRIVVRRLLEDPMTRMAEEDRQLVSEGEMAFRSGNDVELSLHVEDKTEDK